MTAYLKHTDIYNGGIQPAQYVLRDIFLTCCFHFDRGLYLERFSFSLPVKTFFFLILSLQVSTPPDYFHCIRFTIFNLTLMTKMFHFKSVGCIFCHVVFSYLVQPAGGPLLW